MTGPIARLTAWADRQPTPSPKLTECLWVIGIGQAAVLTAVAVAQPARPVVAISAAQPFVLWLGLHAGYQTPA